MDAKELTDEQIDLIANDGMRNAAGGIYPTRVHEFARGVEEATRALLQPKLASMKRMFHAACADLGAINEALSLDPDDGGAEPIISAIEELKAQIAAIPSDAAQAPLTDEQRAALKHLVARGSTFPDHNGSGGSTSRVDYAHLQVAAKVLSSILAAPVAPAAAAPSVDPFAQLLAKHAQELDQNEYAYFELAYTRRTDWMAWICSNHHDDDPERKVLARGQGSTPQEACANALGIAAPTPTVAADAAASAWQPIETAPKDGSRVLVFEAGNRGGVHAAHFMRFPGKIDQWVNPGCHKLRPTHWMPLPAAPQGSAQ